MIEGVGTSKVTAVVDRSFHCSSIPLISDLVLGNGYC